MTHKTHLDALDAELLSRIGKLQVQIENLTSAWTAAAAAAQAETDASLRSLGTKKKIEFGRFVSAEKAAFKELTKEAISETTEALRESADAHRNAVKRLSGSKIKSAAGGVVFAMIGAIIATVGSHELLSKEQARQADLGRAVMAVWDDIPEKHQQRIQGAYR